MRADERAQRRRVKAVDFARREITVREGKEKAARTG
jgi:hypothetical protein